ncbi:hypothetical protein ACFTQ7_20865 [Lysinibacillus sp. NPDC056959]|uniref:hypothetical protein n=1 Tax=Lysinibacillus sp. NPDC056959 TaxID=3345981 RepID=UPI00363FA87F
MYFFQLRFGESGRSTKRMATQFSIKDKGPINNVAAASLSHRKHLLLLPLRFRTENICCCCRFAFAQIKQLLNEDKMVTLLFVVLLE